MDMTFDTSVLNTDGETVTGTCTLADIATWETGTAPDSITSENQTEYVTVTADTLDGYNTTVQSRVLQKALNEFAAGSEMPEGCNFSMGGETEQRGLHGQGNGPVDGPGPALSCIWSWWHSSRACCPPSSCCLPCRWPLPAA